MDWNTDLATYRLEDGQLTARPKGHYVSAGEAQEALRPELEAWEAYVDLTKRNGQLRFKYLNANLVDRDPPSPSEGVFVQIGAGSLTLTGMPVSVSVGKGEYPDPPPFNRIDSEVVRDLLARYRQWQSGGEPLPSMAYAVMTRIQHRVEGNQEKAAHYYNISKKVLEDINKIAGSQGSRLEVRKFTKYRTQPMDNSDRLWLEEAVRKVIQQVAFVEAGATTIQLTKDDLP